MNKRELLKLAKRHHLLAERLGKTELIRAIQLSEGNFDCYASARAGECDQSACLWRKDCFSEAKQAATAGA